MMSLADMTIPNLAGYAVLLWLLILAFAHRSALRECSRRLSSSGDEFDVALQRILAPVARVQVTGEGLGLDVLRTTGRELRDLGAKMEDLHPSARVLQCMLREPGTALYDDLAVSSWMAGAVEAHVGRLRVRMERIRSLAPVAGITGTIVGFMMGLLALSETQDVNQLMGMIALALITTLIGGIVVMIERWELDGTLDPLETELLLHAQELVSRVRFVLRHGAFAEPAGDVAPTPAASVPVLQGTYPQFRAWAPGVNATYTYGGM